MEAYTHLLDAIENSLKHEDYSLLTRRLMDLCEDFGASAELKAEALVLRQLFLKQETAEQSAELKQQSVYIIHQLRQTPPAITAQHNSQQALVIDAKGIGKQFTRGRRAFTLHPLDVMLKPGDITGVVGENGNGKTTLLRILAGELSHDGGALSYPALQVDTHNWYEVKSRLAFIPQRIDKWYGRLEDNLKFYATIHGFTGAENESRIEYILYRLGLEKFRELKWSEISSGYRLRFELAKMLLWKPKLLLLDEPLANLDINAQQLFLQDLRFFTQSATHPVSVILTSQNLHEIERVADNIIFIRQGKTVYNGRQQQFASNRTHNSFELSGNFNLEALTACFNNNSAFTIENAGTSFIINTGIDCNLYTITRLLEQQGLELGYIRDISQSTRKLFHKDI